MAVRNRYCRIVRQLMVPLLAALGGCHKNVLSFSPKSAVRPPQQQQQQQLAVSTTTAALVPSPLRLPNLVPATQDKHTIISSTTALCAASPLGIDELPAIVQVSVFFGAFAGLGFGTVVGTKLLDAYSKTTGLEAWRNSVIDGSVLQSVLGILFLTAGFGHFANADAFRAIYPPPGTWGIWYLPGSASFHVAWTGVVELVGGSGLLYAAYRNLNQKETVDDDDESLLPKLVQPLSASLLFFLTTVVTPANIYMFTHGATMGDYSLGVDYHVIRFAIQVLLLSLLLVLAKDSLAFAWADELD